MLLRSWGRWLGLQLTHVMPKDMDGVHPREHAKTVATKRAHNIRGDVVLQRVNPDKITAAELAGKHGFVSLAQVVAHHLKRSAFHMPHVPGSENKSNELMKVCCWLRCQCGDGCVGESVV